MSEPKYKVNMDVSKLIKDFDVNGVLGFKNPYTNEPVMFMKENGDKMNIWFDKDKIIVNHLENNGGWDMIEPSNLEIICSMRLVGIDYE